MAAWLLAALGSPELHKETGCFREKHEAGTHSWEDTPFSQLREGGDREVRRDGGGRLVLTGCREQRRWVGFKPRSGTVRCELAGHLRSKVQPSAADPVRVAGPGVAFTCLWGGSLCFCLSRWFAGPSSASTWVDRRRVLVEGGWLLAQQFFRRGPRPEAQHHLRTC